MIDNRTSILSLHRLRQHGHRRCLACTHPELRLDFTLDGPRRLRSSVDFTEAMTSFNGMVHGGLIAFLIDEAFTCTLMAAGYYGATGSLQLRYRHPVQTGPTAYILVDLNDRVGPCFSLTAQLVQRNRTCTTAQARFIEKELAGEA